MNFINKIKNLKDDRKKIISNLFWAMLGKVVNMTGTLFVGILVARYLGPEQYGLMNYVISYVALFSIISSFGLDFIEIRELAKFPEKKEIILGTCIRLRFIFTSIAYLLVVLTLILHRTDYYTSIMILAYSLTLYAENFNLIRNYFTSIVKNEYVVKSEITRTIIGAIIKICLLLCKAPLTYFILAAMLDTFLVSSGYYISYKKIVGNISDWKYEKKIVRFYIKEAFPLVLSGAAVVIYQRIDQVMIGNMINNASVGYFSTAGKFVDIILFIPMILTNTISPLLIKLQIKDKATYEKKKRQFVNLVVWSSIILSVLVAIFAYPLIIFTFGEEYAPAIPVLQIMAFKTVGMALSSSSGQIIIMEGTQKWAFIRNIIGCIICILLNYLLIPHYGIIGSAWVTIITVAFTGCFANIFIPPYYSIMKIQINALINGWKDLIHIKQIIR